MQFILDQKEWDALHEELAKYRRLPKTKLLQEMCTKIADEWPTFKGWDGKSEPEPWGCIITADYEHYCDKCPVQNICPKEYKSWSQ